MAYYLSMDGVDDRVRMPSMSFDEVILDCYVEHKTAALQHYFDARVGKGNSQVYRNTSNQDAVGNAVAFTSVSIDGVSVTFTGVTFTPTVPSNQRTVIRAVYSTTTADDLDVFVDRAFTGYTKGRIYNVTMKLTGSTVAYYDMTLGNVQDQSGNGRHATLTGGTWVDDGGGGTSITVNSVTANSTSAVNAPVVATQKNVSVSSVITDSAIQALPPVITNASNAAVTSVTATSSLSTEIPGVSASASLNITSTIANSVVIAIPPFIGSMEVTVNGVVASASSQFVPPTVTIAYDIISVVNLEGVKTFIVQLQGSIEQTVQVLGLKDNIVLLEGEI